MPTELGYANLYLIVKALFLFQVVRSTLHPPAPPESIRANLSEYRFFIQTLLSTKTKPHLTHLSKVTDAHCRHATLHTNPLVLVCESQRCRARHKEVWFVWTQCREPRFIQRCMYRNEHIKFTLWSVCTIFNSQ